MGGRLSVRRGGDDDSSDDEDWTRKTTTTLPLARRSLAVALRVARAPPVPPGQRVVPKARAPHRRRRQCI